MNKEIKITAKPLAKIAMAFCLLVLSLATMSSCNWNTAAYDPYAAYMQACWDASRITEDKIVRNLTAIKPDNPQLIWENGIVGSRVLVVSWVSQAICDAYTCPAGGCSPSDTCKEGRECPYRWDTYVTLAPELKIFFKDKAVTPMRIAQLLGLPPTDAQNKVCFLEMWVSPSDLFRPSPDPEITDHEAEIAFHGAYASRFRQYDPAQLVFADMDCDPEQCPACNEWNQCGFTTYENYINNRKRYIYTSAKPYPWTSLGYTYDWGNPLHPVGLSEFVVNGKKSDGSAISVGIKAVTPTADYFLH